MVLLSKVLGFQRRGSGEGGDSLGGHLEEVAARLRPKREGEGGKESSRQKNSLFKGSEARALRLFV